MKYILTVLYMFFSSSGILLIKLGGDSLKLSFKENFSFNIGYLTTLGFISYIIGFILWQKILTSYNVSFIFPITTGIIQIILLILSITLLHESYTLQSIVGTIIIIIGIIVLTTGSIQ